MALPVIYPCIVLQANQEQELARERENKGPLYTRQ